MFVSLGNVSDTPSESSPIYPTVQNLVRCYTAQLLTSGTTLFDGMFNDTDSFSDALYPSYSQQKTQ